MFLQSNAFAAEYLTHADVSHLFIFAHEQSGKTFYIIGDSADQNMLTGKCSL